jgi:hypothetical protein
MKIQVTFDTHAPDEWNTPVPVEVFDDALRRVGKPRVLNLADGGLIDVDHAGRYYVMATLPTGESVGASVDVAATGATPVAAVLAPAESSPWESLAWAFTRQRLPREREVPKSLGPVELMPRSFRLGTAFFSRTRGPVDVLAMSDRRREWTLKRAPDKTSWEAKVQVADPRLLGRLKIQRLPFVRVPPPDRETRITRSYPLYVRYRALSRQGTPTSTLVAVPAGQAIDREQESVVLFARADAVSAEAPSVQTLVRGARAEAETLLSYFENGVFAAVYQLSASVIERAISLLWDKLEDPFGASIAGYMLLRTTAHPEEQQEREGWMRNLATWFPRIPDGAVIYGASLLRGEYAEEDPSRVDQARSYLLEAVARGIPTYTMGLRLLFDTLRSLAEEREDDAELAAALARVRAIAAYANWTAQTTTLTYPERVSSRSRSDEERSGGEALKGTVLKSLPVRL